MGGEPVNGGWGDAEAFVLECCEIECDPCFGFGFWELDPVFLNTC